jgi:hypothetical protein
MEQVRGKVGFGCRFICQVCRLGRVGLSNRSVGVIDCLGGRIDSPGWGIRKGRVGKSILRVGEPMKKGGVIGFPV